MLPYMLCRGGSSRTLLDYSNSTSCTQQLVNVMLQLLAAAVHGQQLKVF